MDPKPASATVLSAKEEDILVSYCILMAEYSYSLTRTMVKAFAWVKVNKSGKKDHFNPEFGPGGKWWVNLKQRHPKYFDCSCAKALNPHIVNDYLRLLGTPWKKISSKINLRSY